MQILPKNECVAFQLHPEIRLAGSLPSRIPVSQIAQVKTPSPGILLATESGLNLHIAADQPMILEILWDQLKQLQHPTWNEITQFVLLPRSLELARSTANEILRSHNEQTKKKKELEQLVGRLVGSVLR